MSLTRHKPTFVVSVRLDMRGSIELHAPEVPDYIGLVSYAEMHVLMRVFVFPTVIRGESRVVYGNNLTEKNIKEYVEQN
jgi:hypothetical protein